jgi:hypothetical protein
MHLAHSPFGRNLLAHTQFMSFVFVDRPCEQGLAPNCSQQGVNAPGGQRDFPTDGTMYAL